MRTKNAILNLTVSLGAQGVNIFLQFLARFIFVRYFSEEYLGVNGLFTEILTIFSLAELGIGTSMMYGMYGMISRDDKEGICRLMNLYRRLYFMVGAAVAVIGMAMFPFLGYFVGETQIPHIRLIYLLYLINSVSSYFFSYKQTLIRADQKEYIISGVTQIIRCLQVVAQIIIIIATKNFYLYLGVQICCQELTNIVLSVVADRKYPFIKEKHGGWPDQEVKKDIFDHIRAMAVHRFGSVFVFNTDNMLISMFVGLGTVGIYSNYKMVINNLRTVSDYIYNAIIAGVGNLSATESPEQVLETYQSLNMGASFLFGWESVCLLVLFNPFIKLFFGEKYLLPFVTVLIIVIDFYILGMRQMTICFRNAMGLFWYDRYKPIFEVGINLGISLLLVRNYGIAGVISGTIISSLATNFWVEPLVFFKFGIQKNWKKNLGVYYLRYGIYTIFTAGCGILCMWLGNRFLGDGLWGFLMKGALITAVYLAMVWVVFGRTKECNYLKQRIAALIRQRERKGEAEK